jgi:hypothetical protein
VDQTPFTHEHGSVLGPLFQYSFGGDDHEDDFCVSNEDRALNPLDELTVLYCEMLQVLLTPTCHVSGYPRQVIIVDAAETTTVYLDGATNSYNTYNNYTTRHL